MMLPQGRATQNHGVGIFACGARSNIPKLLSQVLHLNSAVGFPQVTLLQTIEVMVDRSHRKSPEHPDGQRLFLW